MWLDTSYAPYVACSSNLEMDHLSVLDLRYGKRTSNKSSELCTLSSFASGPLDLRISKDTEEGRTTVANYDACVSISLSLK